MQRLLLSSLTAAGVLLVGSSPALAKIIVVNNNVSNTLPACVAATFTTINSAYLAASAGDTIDVCPGTYPESLDITKAISLQGVPSNGNDAIYLAPTIGVATTDLDPTSPSPLISASVLVDGVKNVNITNLIIDSTLDSTDLSAENCSVDNVGVYYRNASGHVDESVIRNTGLRSGGILTGCQEGLAVFVQSGPGGAANLSLTESSVHDYDKNGVTVDGAGAYLFASGDTVTGVGSTSITAQNGFQVSTNAKALITHNTVADNLYVPPSGGIAYAAANIIVYNAADYTDVTYNVLSDSNLNVYFQANKGYIASNTLAKGVTYDHIDIYGNNNTINHNNMTRADSDGVYLCGSGNGVHYNLINDALYGVYEDQSSANGCASSASNSATGNEIINVQYQYTPNDATLPHSSAPAVYQKSNRAEPSPFNK